MGKKDFKGGFDGMFSNDQTKTNSLNSSKNENQNEETRATFIVNKEQLNTIKALAYWERKQIKDLIFEAFENLINTKNKEEIEKGRSHIRS